MGELRCIQIRRHRGQLLEGQRAYVVVRLVQFSPDRRAVRAQPFDARSQMNANTRKPLPRIRAIEGAKRHVWDSHFVRSAAAEKTQPEYLESMDGRHLVQVFVDGADQNRCPEALDGAFRLTLLDQPVHHGDLVEILARGAFALQRQQRTAERELVSKTQASHLEERTGEVERAREATGLQYRHAATRFDEEEFFVEGDVVGDVEPFVKIDKVDAAA